MTSIRRDPNKPPPTPEQKKQFLEQMQQRLKERSANQPEMTQEQALKWIDEVTAKMRKKLR